MEFAVPYGVLDPKHTIHIPLYGFQRPLGLCCQGSRSFGEDLGARIRGAGLGPKGLVASDPSTFIIFLASKIQPEFQCAFS